MSLSDEIFMRGALALARRALGQTWPNPAVGAVLVRPGDPGEIIACGHTMPGGRPHAERVALEQAGKRAQGSTLYVTLEPCAHHGQTPPCTDAIVDAGIARVVCSVGDPDPRVSGEGFAILRKAGIEVVTDVLGPEGQNISLGHHLRVTEQRPLVQLKIAVGADGLMAKGDGAPVWVTGEEARAHGHLLRARADAILVGRGTVEADDPMLTCRLPGMEDRSPVRVVLDSDLSLGLDTKLVKTANKIPLWIICSDDADSGRAKALESQGAQVIRVAAHSAAGLDPRRVLAALAERGITRLLIEGGPCVAQSFWSADLVDEVCVYRGPDPVGAGGRMALADEGLDAVRDSPVFAVEATRALGRDILTIHRRSDV